MTAYLQDRLSADIQRELCRLGYRCRFNRLVWFTDKPIHQKSVDISSRYRHLLDEPYMTSLGPAGAVKLHKELKSARQA